jgi:hypothetical protein
MSAVRRDKLACEKCGREVARGARTTVVLRRAWQQDRQRTVDLGRDRQDFETRFISRIAFEGSH